MKACFVVAALLLGLTLFVSCSRKNTAAKSSVLLRLPSGVAGSAKVGALATFPENRKICWAVNVTGPDIPMRSEPCFAPLGVYAGYVEPGSQISLSVSKGLNRRVDVFAYLLNAGDQSICPNLDSTLNSINLNEVYRVGSAFTELTLDEQQVELGVAYPGESGSIQNIFGLPASCSPVEPNPINPITGDPQIPPSPSPAALSPSESVGAASGKMLGSLFQIHGQVSGVNGMQVLQGTHFLIKTGGL